MSKRRGHGEGSIYQRKDGLWVAELYLGRHAAGKKGEGRPAEDPRPRPKAHLATLLLSQGVHPKLVQEQLGHSEISMTLDTPTATSSGR